MPFRSRRKPTDRLTLTRLVCGQEWLRLERILKTDHRMLPIDDNVQRSISENLLVHFACRFQAPLSTIRTLAEKFPESLTHSDASGRFPVHVASKWGATPDVIEFLIGSNPIAATIQDSLGKTPMHYLAEFYTQTCKHNAVAAEFLEDYMEDIARMLKKAAPKAMNLEDNNGSNAIELAIENDAPLSVIKFMQRACRDDWREMKKVNIGRKHADIERDLYASLRQLCTPEKKQLDGKDSRIYISGQLELRVQSAKMA
ncbi:hypothetical protein ACHAXS_004089 [Conticribra weissflogii]